MKTIVNAALRSIFRSSHRRLVASALQVRVGSFSKHKLWMVVIVLSSISPVLPQGNIAFATKVPGLLGVDARATFENGEPVGSGFTAQLFFGEPGTPVTSLEPLLPTGELRLGYVMGPELVIPGISPNELATFVVRVYNGQEWQSSTCRGESLPRTVPLSGGLQPPATLTGLQPFTVTCIPEPSTVALLCAGLVIVFSRSVRYRSIPAQGIKA